MVIMIHIGIEVIDNTQNIIKPNEIIDEYDEYDGYDLSKFNIYERIQIIIYLTQL